MYCDWKKEIEDSDISFAVEGEENKEVESLHSSNNRQPHTIVHDNIESFNNANDQDKCPSEGKKNQESYQNSSKSQQLSCK